MALQVRVRHALGERLVDLTDRPVERPLIVGRSREADLKIPSVTVGSAHCSLFVHDRQWVLQDTSGGATFVNGAPIDGPTPLCIGDEIMLGTDASPAIIEVDPAGVAQGRSGHPAETHDVVPAPVSRATMVAPQAPAAPRQAPASRTAPAAPPVMQYAAPPPPIQPGWDAQPAAQDDPFAGWGAPAPSTEAGATPARRRKKPTRVSPAAIAGGAAACLGLILGVVFFIIHQTTTPPPIERVAAPSAAPKDEPSGDLFDMRGVTSRHPEKSTATAAPTPARPPKAAPAPPPDSTDSPPSTSTPDANPSRTDATPPAPAPAMHKDQDAWESVETAFAGPALGAAIVKSEDYRRQHPTESYKDLDAMIDNAMDQLWWRRIGTLCGDYKTKTEQIKAKERDIREETSAAFKKDLLAEKKALDDDLAKIQMHLTADMAYTGTEVPPIDNKEVMTRLRDERDKEKFGAWKISTLKYTKSHRGAMPWDS